ncbi:MAG: response regulator [Pyrinomonadaceae bacterium]
MAEDTTELRKLNALVIDDSKVMRSMVINALTASELADFTFAQAGSGREALDDFDANTTDIIFVDWNMPDMNGIEFARMVRSMSWASHIPIVMITSESGEGKQKDAFEKARITTYITKPFTPAEIKEMVAPVIEKIPGGGQPAPTASKPAAPAAKAPSSGGFFSSLLK